MRTELRMPRLSEIPVVLKSTPVLGTEVFIRSTAFIIFGASFETETGTGVTCPGADNVSTLCLFARSDHGEN